MSEPSLLDRLLQHRTLGVVPRAELEWIAARGEVHHLAPGDILTATTGEVAGLWIVLDGRLSIRIDRGAGPRKVMEWQAGDLTGLLPYSRLKAPPAAVIADEPSTVVLIERSQVAALPSECPALTAVCVHVMLDRARQFTSSELFDEKLVSLGRLAAGLAHELNNPASAVVRDASRLAGALAAFEGTTQRFCALPLSGATRATVKAVRESAAAAADTAPSGSLDVADREDALITWLSAHALPDSEADRLVDAGITVDHLEQLATAVGDTNLTDVLDHVAAAHAVHRLAADIETAAARVHELVAAVKRFTYMDQAMVAAPIHLGQGLADTMTVLGSKARHKNLDLALEVASHLPMVDAYGGELNQVWTNLVDNAIHATPAGGRINVSARHEGDFVVVRVADTGPGIPKDIQARVFDPFFTTKRVGEGSGLGLDIARRLVVKHRGQIELTSGSSGTEFRVTLPVTTARVPSTARA